MSLLEARGLVKTFRTRRVVDGVDLRVERGEIVGLLGPNGAGKTTSFRMICGLLQPNAGQVYLGDTEVTSWPMYRRCRDGRMGYLAQESSVFRKLNVQQNLTISKYTASIAISARSLPRSHRSWMHWIACWYWLTSYRNQVFI